MKETLTTKNLILKTPSIEDFSSLKAFDSSNKAHLEKWESITDLTDDDDQNRLINWRKECEQEKSARFFIFDKKNPNRIIGMCNLTQIFRGLFQACYLGYKIDHAYQGKGIMFEALQETVRFAFEDFKLHRIMANYMPTNIRSANLLSRLGFEVEGHAKKYLLINNKWEDHTLTSLSYEQWQILQKDSVNFTPSNERQLESYLHQQIPISKAIGIKALYASLEKVILAAPFSNNINHKKTIFGGSLHAVATLACWSLLHLNLKNKNLKNQIVITQSETNYHLPVDADFKVECELPDQEDWKRFIKILNAKKKGRIHLSARIYHQEQLCVSYRAAFAAILKE
jgi:thioesterase domain-containing protein